MASYGLKEPRFEGTGAFTRGTATKNMTIPLTDPFTFEAPALPLGQDWVLALPTLLRTLE
jgi:hypothetical protein